MVLTRCSLRSSSEVAILTVTLLLAVTVGALMLPYHPFHISPRPTAVFQGFDRVLRQRGDKFSKHFWWFPCTTACLFLCLLPLINSKTLFLLYYQNNLSCTTYTQWYNQFSSVTQSCLTLCNSMDCSTPGLPVHHQLSELAQTHVHQVGDAIQPSHPLSSLSPPVFNLSQHRGLF